MAIVCKDSVRHGELKGRYDRLEIAILTMRAMQKEIHDEMSSLIEEVYSEAEHTEEYTLMVDRFIRETGYRGRFEGKWVHERHFHWDPQMGWNVITGMSVYYRDVALRYKQLVQLGIEGGGI